jgi:transposase-like protein
VRSIDEPSILHNQMWMRPRPTSWPIWHSPAPHRAKLHSTNPIEQFNGEIKRRSNVARIFPNEEAIVRLVGAILIEQNDEWAVRRGRYMTLKTINKSTSSLQWSKRCCMSSG